MPTFMMVACGIHAATIKNTPLDIPDGAKTIIKDVLRILDNGMYEGGLKKDR